MPNKKHHEVLSQFPAHSTGTIEIKKLLHKNGVFFAVSQQKTGCKMSMPATRLNFNKFSADFLSLRETTKTKKRKIPQGRKSHFGDF